MADRTPRYPPLLVFAVAAVILIGFVPIKWSSVPLAVIWIKKHDLWAALSGNDPWNAVLRVLGLRWTREVETKAAKS